MALWLFAGCGRKDNGASPPTAHTGSLAEQQDLLDATVWHDEILAQRHERTMVQLADDLRRATNKPAVLAQFPFQKIAIPRPAGSPEELPLAIHRQSFVNTNPLMLSHESWEAAVAQFQKAGWTLVQAEWRHEKFVPPTVTNAARSEFQIELHGEQAAESNRFIVTGTLVIEWEALVDTNRPARPGQITVRDLSLLERRGSPAFKAHLLLAPEPDRPNGQVNLHPVIVSDINGDLHDDIVLPSINKVLLNDGQANFRAVTLIDERQFQPLQNAGVLADFNGDGKPDYLGVAELGPMARMVVLYPGSGALPFTAAPLVAWEEQRSQFALLKTSRASVITAADIDGDGDLDIYVAQYKPPYVGGQIPTPYYDANDGFPSVLLVNDGHGHFEQARSQPALRAKSHRRTLAASFVDLDGDGDADLVTLNDYSGLDLFYNDGTGKFSDETGRLDNRAMFGMGLCFADFNHDGAVDLFATGMSIPAVHRLEAMGIRSPGFPDHDQHRADMGYGNRLFVRQGNRWIQPRWARQLAPTGWTWGVCALDFDNDGALDLYFSNGHVSGESIADYDSQCWTHDMYMGSSRENPEVQRYVEGQLQGLNSGKTSWAGYLHNVLHMDVGSNHYANVAFLMDVAHESDCRAAVSADFNEDGRPDLVVTEAKWQGTPNNMRHQLLVHLNQAETTNHWIGVRLAGPGPKIGTKILVTTESGGRLAQIVTGDSFQSQQPNAVHFGLGPAPRIKDVRVVSSRGESILLPHPQVDRWNRVEVAR